jgi:hypothetical protein
MGQVSRRDERREASIFFDRDHLFVNQMTSHLYAGDSLSFWVNKEIVEHNIGGSFFDSSDSEESVCEALSIFKEVDGENNSDGAYKVTIKKKTAFWLTNKYVSA